MKTTAKIKADTQNKHTFVAVNRESPSPTPSDDEENLISNENNIDDDQLKNNDDEVSISNEHKLKTSEEIPSFVANSAIMEARIIFGITMLIAIQCLSEIGTAIIVCAMVGNYYDDDKYLSAVGIGSSFVSITGMNIVYVNNFNHDENKSRTKY